MLQRICTGLALALVLAASMALAQAYRWVDENGVVHYSDRPQAGAEEVELESAPALSRPAQQRVPASRRTSEGEPAPDAAAGYEALEIAAPASEETLWNIGGVLNVSLTLQPALKQGHQLRVYFDGNPQAVNSTQFQLQEVYRGVHNLQAEVLDENGQLLIRSPPNRFYVQQTTIVNPRGG
jgi:hypothetical protein